VASTLTFVFQRHWRKAGGTSTAAAHLLLAVGDVSDLVPGEGALGRESVVGLVDMQAQGVHPEQQICPLLILYPGGKGV
jgi:hypothetical protein